MRPTSFRLRPDAAIIMILLPALTAGCVPVTDGLLGGPPLSALSASLRGIPLVLALQLLRHCAGQPVERVPGGVLTA